MILAGGVLTAGETRIELAYAPAPPDNPLKGLVPYAGQGRDFFPHSLEFNYLPLSALVTNTGTFDWQPLEKLLNDIAGRGNQAIFRIFLEYPGKKNAIPAFLIQAGLKVHAWNNPDAAAGEGKENETPDYSDPRLRQLLKDFIAALGRRYDGDPRIGFITAGLLGMWGEWHTYPRGELFASKPVQAEVLDAYTAAFKKTHVLLRYPAGEHDESQTPNHARRFGYHDDSFAWATLETGNRSDDWFFMSALRRAGPAALDKWKSCPIGGEIRPEAWGYVFDAAPGNKKIQDFNQCVQATHATWLMDSGMFRKNVPAERRARAIEQVCRMGYEFYISAVTFEIKAESISVRTELLNKGVAPFYYDWKPELGLLDADRKLVHTVHGSGSLLNLLPSAPARTWTDEIDRRSLKPGMYTVLLRITNPLPTGKPLRFANSQVGKDRDGWLTLGTVDVGR
ncbi:MAG TPA: DUF4832 domain-containing protein [Planctomycetota bacterium]|nr:DUF4832 domain-containing protein [Planctomycetota bacterium]